MSGDEQKTMNKAENHARSAIIPSSMFAQTIVTHKHKRINKIPNCFSCPGDCIEVSKKTR